MAKIVSRELVALLAIIGMATMAMAVLQPVLPLYLTSIGISPTMLGLMLSSGMAGMMLGESGGGWVADRIGIKVPLFIGTAVCAPLVLCFVFTTNPIAIFGIFFLWGVVRAAIFGPGRGYIGTRIPITHKATFMAIYAASMALSRSAGSLTSGFIADARGYPWVFYTAAALGILGGAIVLLGLKGTSRPTLTTRSPRRQDAVDPDVPLYRHRPFIVQSAIAAVQFAAVGISPFMSLLAAQVAHLPASDVGILFTIGGITNAVLLVPMGRLADHKSKRMMMAIGLAVTAAGQALIGTASGFPQMAAGVIVQGTGGALFGPAAVALLSENVPARRQNTAMGIYGACEDGGVIIGSALGGVVWSLLGPAPTFLLVGSATATLGVLMTMTMLRSKTGTGVQEARAQPGNQRA